MRKLLMLIAAMFVAAIPANAQDSYPSAEIFGGYSYMNADLGDRESLHGWGLSFAGNLGPSVGLVGEFSGHYGNQEVLGIKFDTNIHTFLFGPRFSARGERVTGFGHILVGGARFGGDLGDDTGFAMAVGAGVDVNAGSGFAIRLVQVDYLPTRLGGDWQHNMRVQAGFVIKLGEN